MTGNNKSAEEIVRGLRGCIDSPTCEKCKLFGRCNGTFASLCDIAAAKITELDDFRSSQCAKLLARVAELEVQLAEETSRRYQAECNYDHWKADCEQVCAQLTASQQRESVLIEALRLSIANHSGDERQITRLMKHYLAEASGHQEESFISKTIDGVETAVVLRSGRD